VTVSSSNRKQDISANISKTQAWDTKNYSRIILRSKFKLIRTYEIFLSEGKLDLVDFLLLEDALEPSEARPE